MHKTIERTGGALLRYGLVAILLYFGAFKFTAVEAEAIRPLVENSPLMSWLYGVLSVQGVSNLIGGAEVMTAALIALRPWSPRAAAAGSLLGVATFLATLSFLVTTPESWAFVDGFPLPVPSGAAGFIVKDWFLLGAAVWSAGEALGASAGEAALEA
jgi:CRISPR-associated Cas5-like protein